jgi:DNA-binding LacI/PurR family transcriptional regulator
VRQPVDEVGRRAAETLGNILDGRMPETLEIGVPTELIVRDSVGKVARLNNRKEPRELIR